MTPPSDETKLLLQAAVEFCTKRAEPAGTANSEQWSPSLHSMSSDPGKGGGREPTITHASYDNHHHVSTFSFPPEHTRGGYVMSSIPSALSSYEHTTGGSANWHPSPSQPPHLPTYYPQPPMVHLPYNRAELVEIKFAIVEFYRSLHRNITVADVWLSLVAPTASSTAAAPSASASSRRGQVVSPPPQQQQTNVAGTNNNNNDNLSDVDWKKMFRILDHRRLVSFGLVHGIIRRIHNYPMVVDGIAAMGQEQGAPPPSSASVPIARDESRLFTSSQRHLPHEQPQQQQPSSALHALPLASMHTTEQQEANKLRQRVLSMMNGRHCDDELVSTFEKSLEDLFDIVQGRRIVSTFAPAHCPG